MVESTGSSHAHQELLTLKEHILAQWLRLPPEHQATMLLVLTEQVNASEYGPWAAQALQLLSAVPESPQTPQSFPSSLTKTLPVTPTSHRTKSCA